MTDMNSPLAGLVSRDMVEAVKMRWDADRFDLSRPLGYRPNLAGLKSLLSLRSMTPEPRDVARLLGDSLKRLGDFRRKYGANSFEHDYLMAVPFYCDPSPELVSQVIA